MLKEAEEKKSDISKKLEEMRKELIKSGALNSRIRGSMYFHEGRAGRPEKRVPLKEVSVLIDVPVNELILHFLNGHRITEGEQLVEYRLGCVFFYGQLGEEVE